MVLKRSMAVVLAAAALVAVGCSSKADEGSSATTTVTAPQLTNGGTGPANDTGTTLPPLPPLAVVRAPDPVAFCTTFSDAQDLTTKITILTFQPEDALALLNAPNELQLQAQKLRVTAPDAALTGAEAYAALFDGAADAMRSVRNLRQIGEAMIAVNQGPSDPNVKPAVDWIVRNCGVADPDASEPTAP